MKKEEIKKMISEIIQSEIIRADKIPDIPLYMDQVTTFAEDNLSVYKRSADEKLLTKTMINNYTKFGLIEAPVKKKYKKSSIISLILIYYFKNIISINDIKEILTNVEENKKTEIYDLYTKLQEYDSNKLSENAADDMETLFDEDYDEKTTYLLTAMLLIDQANIRKQAAERLIDKFLAKK